MTTENVNARGIPVEAEDYLGVNGVSKRSEDAREGCDGAGLRSDDEAEGA
jgi:hypothetical protein